jgi:hypothetical protein
MRTQSIKRRINVKLIIMSFLLAGTLLLQACDDDRRSETQERSGGMVVTTETPASQPDTTAGESESATPTTPPDPTPTPEPTPIPLAVGQVVTGLLQARLHSDASSASPVLEVYEPGAVFTILESSEEGAAYPVAVGGNAWYRVRAADGLAGWVRADSFSAE